MLTTRWANSLLLVDGQVVLTTLLTRLRKGHFLRSASVSYPSLLPFLASLHPETLTSPTGAPGDAMPSLEGLQQKDKYTLTFGEEFMESIWRVADKPQAGARLRPAQLADVVVAYVESVTFFMLKLPPDIGDSSSATVVSAAAQERLVDAVAELVLGRPFEGGCWDGKPAREETSSLRHRLAGNTATVCGVLGRSLAQLHLAGIKGSGVMGSRQVAAEVWGKLEGIFKKALDERYHRTQPEAKL